VLVSFKLKINSIVY